MQSVDGDVRLSVGLDTKSVKQNMNDLGRTMKQSLDSFGNAKGFDDLDVKAQKLRIQIEKAARKISDLKKEIDKVSTTTTPTDEFTNLNSQIDKLIQTYDELDKKRKDLKSVTTYTAVQEREYQSLTSQMEKLDGEIDKLISKRDALAESGKAETVDTAKLDELNLKLKQAQVEYTMATQKLQEFQNTQKQPTQGQPIDSTINKQLKNTVKNTKSAFNTVKKIISSIVSVAKSAFSKVSKIAKSAFSSIISHAKRTRKVSGDTFTGINDAIRKGIKNLLRYGLGIRGTFMLFRKLRNAVKEGFQNLAQYSDEVNGDISDVMSAFTKLKNALAIMFQPLLRVVAPVLTSIINKASQVATSIGKLIAAFTGQEYVYEAVDVQQDYAKSLDKTSKSATKAKKALEAYTSPLDDINKFQENQIDNDTDIGEDDGTIDPSKMFKISSVESKFKDLAKKLKDILSSTDWTQIGTMLGEKLNDILGNIDWASIQQKARDFATRLYTLINGFVNSVDWTLVGKTIAEGIKTGLIFLDTLINNLDFSAVGKALGNIINGLADPENAMLLARVIVGWVTGALTTVSTMLQTIDWSKLSNTIIAFITNFDLKTISDAVINFLNSFATALGSIQFDKIGEAFRDGISKINWSGIWDGVVDIATNALKGIGDLLGIDFDTSKLNEAFKSWKEPVEKLLGSFKSLVQKILPVIVEKLLPAAVDLIGNIVSALSPVIDALAPVISTILEAVSRIIKAISPVLPKLGEAVGKLVKVLTPFIEKVVDIIAQIVEKLAPALGDIFEILGDVFEILTPIFDLLTESLEPVLDILGGITDVIGGIIKASKGMFNGVSDEVLAGTEQMLQGFVDFLKGIVRSIFDSLIKPLQMGWEIIKSVLLRLSSSLLSISSDVWENIKTIWSNVGNFFGGVWRGIASIFQNVGQWFSDRFSDAWQGIVNIWKNVGNFFRNIWDGIVNVFKGAGDWFRGTFDKAVLGIKNAFNGVEQWFANLWQGIWNVIKTPLNWIIDGINSLIGGLNNVKIDVPDWVPFIGGKRFGFDIPKIPRLAQGAVIPPNKEFLAVLGDQKQGTNIEAPANLIRQIVREEMQNSSTCNKYEIPLVVGRQTLYKLIIDEAKLKMAQTGANPFDLITV